jgi:predicted nucleotide-binding protein
VRSRIFVGSSREAIDVSRTIQQELDDDFDVTVWDQDVFQLSYGALESLLDALETCDAGLFVLGPDDLTESRGESRRTAQDNVIFELGMFIGRLGRDRTYMLMPAGLQMHLPSDLSGLTVGAYDLDRFQSGQRRAAVGAACTRVRQALKSLGPHLPPNRGSRHGSIAHHGG